MFLSQTSLITWTTTNIDENMRDDNSTETGDNTNNSSTDNSEDTSVKKGIE